MSRAAWGTGGSGLALFLGGVAVGATDLVLYRIIKRWIARPRPAGIGTVIVERVRPLDVFSFPSGHVMHAVACSVVLTAYMTRVERLLPCCVVRRIHDFLDFRGDPFKHDFESLPQRHLRGRTSLAAAAHGDEKLPSPDLHNRNLPAVVSD